MQIYVKILPGNGFGFRMANLPRSGGSAFYWHLTPWPPLLESLSRAKAREEGEKGVGGKGGEVHENNEKLIIDNTEWPIFRAAEQGGRGTLRFAQGRLRDGGRGLFQCLPRNLGGFSVSVFQCFSVSVPAPGIGG